MCGIVGIINLKYEQSLQAEDLHCMTNSIRHRGPDDEGFLLFDENRHYTFYGDDTPVPEKQNYRTHALQYYTSGHISNAYNLPSHIAFGHRRLSIIDLTVHGHQPMQYLDRYWIIYNGEIYNYIEVRNELAKNGYHFHSNSDTEVILAAYDCWGNECLNIFNGMWAFAIYDKKKHKLFISKDRFGIKPLYYYKDDKYFIFASEIKAILSHREVKTFPDINYCREYIAHGPREYIKETAFKNIFRFKNASFVEIAIHDLEYKNINEQIFWNCVPNLNNEVFDNNKAEKYAKKYYEILSDAVRIRLRADVKVGAALSGGLDSSTIVYMINEHLKRQGQDAKLETFSNIYKSENVNYCDESQYINQLAKFLNVKSNQIEPILTEIISEHKKMIYAMENPAVGPNMGGWYTFKLVGNSDITINLDGQGADEQLGGYFSYIWRYVINLPLSDLVKEFKAFLHLPGLNKIYLILSVICNILRRVFPVNLLEIISRYLGDKNKDNAPIFEPLNKILYQSTMTDLLNLIHYGDSQSMAHSIESRLPFMDYRLVEFLASVPANYKIHNGWTKYIARIAMDKILPDNITWRKDKMGWPDPSEFWFRGPLKEWLCREVESSSFLKELGFGYNIRNRINGKEPIINLIRLLNLSVWYNIFFKNAV